MEELRRVLGLAQDTADAFLDLDRAKREGRARDDAAAGTADAALGNPAQAEASRAYRNAYAIEGAQSAATDWDRKVTEAVRVRLVDENDAATIEDIDAILDAASRDFAVVPETGELYDFGHPQATRHVAETIREARIRLRGAAIEVIKERADGKLLGTMGFNEIQRVLRRRLDEAVTPADVPASTAAPAAEVAEGTPLAPAARTSFARMVDITLGAESGNRDFAPGGGVLTSPKGAKGRMQVLDGTNRDPGFGVRPAANNSLEERARVGRDYLAAMLERYGNDPAKAWAAYNGGPGRVDAAVKKHGDKWLAHMPEETRKYVRGNVGKLGGSAPVSVDVNAGAAFAGDLAEPTEAEKGSAPAPRIDFEGLMARVPPTIERAKAKAGLLTSLIVAADEAGDASLLDNLWHSTRADGTPSFSPAEIADIREARDAIRNRIRIEADRAKADRYEQNEEAVVDQIVQGGMLSISELRRLSSQDHIRGSFAFSLINQVEAEQRQEVRELRMEQREADREADAEVAYSVATEAEAFRAGALGGNSEEALRRRLDAGEFGSGKRALAHYRMLSAALRQGREVAAKSPEAAAAAARWESLKPKLRRGDGSLISVRAPGVPKLSPEAHAAGAALIRKLIREGTDPAVAYQEAYEKYGKSKPAEDRQQRIRELRELRARAGR